MMNARKPSVRYWLQRLAFLRPSNDLRPFNSKWTFKHYRHDREARRLVSELREIADGLEDRLDAIKRQAEEHTDPRGGYFS